MVRVVDVPRPAIFRSSNRDAAGTLRLESCWFALGATRHVPNPGPHFVEHDHFEKTEASFSLIKPDGTTETIDVMGPTSVDVWFEDREGEAHDDDGDGKKYITYRLQKANHKQVTSKLQIAKKTNNKQITNFK